MRHIENISSYYIFCLDGENTDVARCMKNVDYDVNNGRFCRSSDYEKAEYIIREIEFNELDYYWHVGMEMISLYKEDFALRMCEDSIAFWGSFLGWSCDRLVQEHYER